MQLGGLRLYSTLNVEDAWRRRWPEVVDLRRRAVGGSVRLLRCAHDKEDDERRRRTAPENEGKPAKGPEAPGGPFGAVACPVTAALKGRFFREAPLSPAPRSSRNKLASGTRATFLTEQAHGRRPAGELMVNCSKPTSTECSTVVV
jgi:hypothetical protein